MPVGNCDCNIKHEAGFWLFGVFLGRARCWRRWERGAARGSREADRGGSGGGAWLGGKERTARCAGCTQGDSQVAVLGRTARRASRGLLLDPAFAIPHIKDGMANADAEMCHGGGGSGRRQWARG